MKAKHPLVSALTVLGCTIAAIVAVFVCGTFATAAIFGDSDEAYWGFTLCFMIFAPIALLTGITLAVVRFVRGRRIQNASNETNLA